MKMLTSEGNIVEGTPLTDEDVEVLEVLKRDIGGIRGHYLSGRAVEQIAHNLILNYHITRRVNPISTVYDGPIEMPDSPVTQATPVPLSDDGAGF